MTEITYTTDVLAYPYGIDNQVGYDIVNIAPDVSILGGTGIRMGASQMLRVYGLVEGASDGVSVEPLSGQVGDTLIRISDTGRVVGEDFSAINLAGSDNRVVNDGLISGSTYGIHAEGTGASIVNNGSLVIVGGGMNQSGHAAIGLESAATVVNRGDIIAYNQTYIGDYVAIQGSDEQDIISNTGLIIGAVYLNSGNDTFNSTGGQLGRTTGTVFERYAPIDGGAGNDRIYGGTTDDVLIGGFGNDVVAGNQGNDDLFGGDGIDNLTGGAGRDNFIFDSALNAATNWDVIKDYAHAQGDHIELEDSIFRGLALGGLTSAAFYAGRAAHDANDRIIYNPVNGALYYDRDGTGAAAAVHFATVANHATLNSHDFIVI